MIYRMLGLGILMALVSFVLFSLYYHDLEKARTMAFNTLVMFELFNMFNCRSLTYSSLKMGFFSNKKLVMLVMIAFVLQVIIIQYVPISSALNLTTLGLKEWGICILAGSSILILGELKKNVRKLNFLPF